MNTFTTLALGAEPVARGVMFANDRDWDGPPWPFLPIVPILIIALVWFVVGRGRGRLAARRSGETVLAERYARGEIDEHEYRQRRTVLRRRKD